MAEGASFIEARLACLTDLSVVIDIWTLGGFGTVRLVRSAGQMIGPEAKGQTSCFFHRHYSR